MVNNELIAKPFDIFFTENGSNFANETSPS